METNKSIMILEDDDNIATGLVYALSHEGFAVTQFKTVAESLLFVEQTKTDLALLDVSLPDGNGYDVCRRIKEKHDTPVIFLTVNDDELNVVMGLDMGADDYITKPFRLRELISRMNSVLRRYQKGMDYHNCMEINGIKMNLLQNKVHRRGEEIILTALEYRLLLTLFNHEGQVLSRNQLLEGIWDIGGEFVNDNTLSVYIKRLREKIEDDPQNPHIIKTIRGLGYKAGE